MAVFIVTDLGYGDCGKGTTVDWLSRRAPQSTMVVRHNGGPQAGHNVVTVDGAHHCFSQFGSGSLAGAKTLLSRFMLVNPLGMMREASALTDLTHSDPWLNTYVDENCRLITSWHIALNRLLELSRGDGRHGSCGQGVGAAMQQDLLRPDLTVRVKDIRTPDFTARLEQLRRYLRGVVADIKGCEEPPWVPASSAEVDNFSVLDDNTLAKYLTRRFTEWADLVNVIDPALNQILRNHQQVIFEGAQGVLLDEWFGFCLTPDTEVLTDRGWAAYETLEAGATRVSCFDLTSGQYRWETIQHVHRRHFDGELVHLRTRGMDCLATPNHRVVMRTTQRSVGKPYSSRDWKFRPATEVPGQVQIPIGGSPVGPGIPELTLQNLRIMGWVITDGCWNGRTNLMPNQTPVLRIDQALSTTKRSVNICDEMRSVLSAIAGISCYNRAARPRPGSNTGPSNSWYLGPGLSSTLLAWLGREIHRIPRVVLDSCSKEQLAALYQGLMEGDGTSENGKWKRFYVGKNEALADEFQELCLRLGISTTKSWVRSNSQCQVSIADRQYHSMWKRPTDRVTYSGEVWDITVPTGAFVARRNGQVFVTGNSPYTTWSTCTHHNALALLKEAFYDGPLTRLGVIRAVTTRHGPGPHPTEDTYLTRRWNEPHNATGVWQREFRVGHLDLVAHRYAATVCAGVDELVVTHLDREDKWLYCPSYEQMDDIPVGVKGDLVKQARIAEMVRNASPELCSATTDGLLAAIEAHLGVPVAIGSYGPTAADKNLMTGALHSV